MIEQQARVIEIDGDTVWLEAERESTCSDCQVKQGCGTGLLAKHVGKKFSKISVHKTTDTTMGEVVMLVIPEEALLQGAALMYLLPLTLLFLFSIITRSFDLGEGAEILAGLTGLVTGFAVVKEKLRNKKDGIQAKVLEE
jgi:sigma-E factor negative regulatory protein RseC|tara:strand:- start:1109 stop:1528 length:420 start_codon:yes stop_codon:yes gene_type:complete